jgi:rod shape-determining protein MreD
MNSSILIRQTLWFVVLILAQALVFNNIGLHSFLNPFIYVFFVLMLPSHLPRMWLLVLAFCTGFVLDIFSNTAGMHASACAVLGFVKPMWFGNVIRLDPDEEFEMADFSFGEFLRYTTPLIFVHHLVLFVIESLVITDILPILLQTVLNTVLTTAFVVILRYLFVRKQRR